MATTYVEFSILLPIGSDADERWWQAHLNVPGTAWNRRDEPRTPEARMLRMVTGGENNWGFVHEFGECCLWFGSRGEGAPGQVAKLIQLFFREMNHPTDVFHITYSERCDRPRVNEFGGGAYMVTADEIKRFTTWQWLDNQEEQKCTPSASPEAVTTPKSPVRSNLKSGPKRK